jgi:hypothetical protein
LIASQLVHSYPPTSETKCSDRIAKQARQGKKEMTEVDENEKSKSDDTSRHSTEETKKTATFPYGY